MLTKMLIAIVCVCLLTMTACQPTPEIPPFANRAAGIDGLSIIDPLLDGEYKQIDAPERLVGREELANGNIILEMDVDVVVPKISNTPVIELRDKGISQEFLIELVDYFTPDARFYKIPPMTRTELEEELILMKERSGDYSAHYLPITAYEMRVMELLENAPETEQREYVDVVFDYPYQEDSFYIRNKEKYLENERIVGSQNVFKAIAEADDTITQRFEVQNHDRRTGSSSFFEYSRGIIIPKSRVEAYQQSYEIYFSGVGTSLDELGFGPNPKWLVETRTWLDKADNMLESPSITYEVAIERAEQVLRDLGIDHLGFEEAVPGIQFLDGNCSGYRLNNMGLDWENAVGGYSVFFSRHIDGLFYSSIRGRTVEDATALWPENLSVFVTDEGVQQFNWYNVSETVSVIAENTQLSDFETVFANFKNLLVYSSYPGAKYRYVLTDVSLCAMNTTALNAPLNAWAVPTWVFAMDSYTNTDAGEEVRSANFRRHISAIDGKYIPLFMGDDQPFSTIWFG